MQREDGTVSENDGRRESSAASDPAGDRDDGAGRTRRGAGPGPAGGGEYGRETDDPPKAGRDGGPVVRLSDVTRRYASETAVEDVSLSVRDGELLTLLGPSGCGKTTTLRLLAGLERPTGGTIEVADRRVAGGGDFVKPEERGIGLVFQEFALFPHLTVEENVAFGLNDAPADRRERRVEAMLDLVGLSEYRDRSPGELSGGQRQRVALARSLAPEPDVLLLDEPFSNLDIRLRVEMREEVRHILKEAGVTAVSVTHDQEEALSISDRVAVMNDGRIEQVGRPEEVFQHPESRFVASFLGQASFLSGQVSGDRVVTEVGPVAISRLAGLDDTYGGALVDVLVRPDDLRATPTAREDADGEIVYRQYNGPNFVYRVELDNGDVVHCQHNHAEEFTVGEPVRVDLAADHSLAWYPAEPADEDPATGSGAGTAADGGELRE